MNICFSWDDGAKEDLKLISLHKKWNIPGMFFVPTNNIEGRAVLTINEIRDVYYNNNGLIDFGGHTQSHVYLTSIPLSDIGNEIKENKEYLENIIGRKIKHFCLPGGKYNKEILGIINKEFETVRTADTMNFQFGNRLVKPSIHFYDRGIKSIIGNGLKNYSVKETIYFITHADEYFKLMRKFILKYSKTNKNILIWGHSWEIEESDLWDELEELFRIVSQNSNIIAKTYDEFLSH